jgi:hypothetical protein
MKKNLQNFITNQSAADNSQFLRISGAMVNTWTKNSNPCSRQRPPTGPDVKYASTLDGLRSGFAGTTSGNGRSEADKGALMSN